MGYRGYSEYICHNGHYWKVDAGFYYQQSDEHTRCEMCLCKAKWQSRVDTTNGVSDNDPDSLPAPKRKIGRVLIRMQDPKGIQYHIERPLYQPIQKLTLGQNQRWFEFEVD